MSGKKTTLLIVLLLILDQAVKILVKTNMPLDGSITVFPNWFFIRFIENPGAAFGFRLSGEYGKLALSLFRVLAVIGIGWYMHKLTKRPDIPSGVIAGLALILAGAMGNIFDSAFYGVLFTDSTYTQAAHFAWGGSGNYGFLHGNVVDMLYFPIAHGTYPGWFPWVGGDRFVFFSPVFNIADSYISIGIAYLLVFQNKFFR